MHNITNKFLVMEKEQVDQCTRLAETYYCKKPEIVHTAVAEECLIALWMETWTNMKASCVWHARRAGTMAWEVTPLKFMVYSAKETLWVVKCPDKPTETHKTAGYQLVWLMEGCSIISGDVEVQMPPSTVEDYTTVTVKLSEKSLQEIVGQLPAKPEIEGHLAQPIVDITDQILQSMEEEDNGLPILTWIAMGLAGTAVIMMAILLAVFYCKYRRAATQQAAKLV